MGRKIVSRWWLVLLAIVVGACVGAVNNLRTQPVYVARTTLMASETSSVAERKPSGVTMGDMLRIARSNAVMQESARTLVAIGVKLPPDIRSATKIEAIKDSAAFTVEVTLPDSEAAKEVTDVVGASVKKVCNAKHRPVVRTLDSAYVYPSRERHGDVPLWVGRTTLLVVSDGLLSNEKVKMNTLGLVARSNQAMADAASRLADADLKYAPDELLSTSWIEPVKDTNLLAVSIALPDPHAAKETADVVAASIERGCEHFRQFTGASLRIVGPATVRPINQHRQKRLLAPALIGLALGVVIAAVLPKGGRILRTLSETS